jgi:hypothetical protein
MPRRGKRVPASTGSDGTCQARPAAGLGEYPRTARWDAAEVLRQLGRSTGIELTNAGRCPGGQIGAYYVRWPDGHLSVLTCRPSGQLAAAKRAQTLTAVARARGIPAPRYELISELPEVTVIVQELLPGAPPTTMTRPIVESMLEVNLNCRGLLTGRTELPAPSLYLVADGPGFCLHGAMASYDRRTARLLQAIEAIGAAVPATLQGDDLVHFDFHPENVLVDPSGTLTGVVDWDGAGRSNGVLDLVTLRFDLARRAPELGRWVGGQLRDSATEPVALACWAHMSLRLIDWSIRELTAADVSAWTAVAEELMPGTATFP